MFEGFEQRRMTVDGVGLNVRIGGEGPPVVLIHGYPQTHIMWRHVAPKVAEFRTVILFDQRGYGDSDCPEAGDNHENYAKRRVALDVIGIMDQLGHEQFAVLSHDRGARVGYRLCLDHPERVTRYVSLDVVPTHDMWLAMDKDRALGGFHWPFLAQPAPKPETQIGADPDHWLSWLMESWAAPGYAFEADAMAEYKRAFRNPDVIRGTCEDYRAGATVDDEHDAQDKEAGNKIQCPILCLWGAARDTGGPKTSSPLDVWRNWCTADVSGGAVAESGHFLAEEAPERVLESVVPFLREDA